MPADMMKKLFLSYTSYMNRILAIVLALCTISCSSYRERKEEKRVAASLKQWMEIVHGPDSAKISPVTVPDGLVYIANTDCSVCIADCLIFVRSTKLLDTSIPLYVAFEDGQQSLMDYYMSISGNDPYNSIPLSEAEYHLLQKQVRGNVLLIQDGMIKKTGNFIDKRIL